MKCLEDSFGYHNLGVRKCYCYLVGRGQGHTKYPKVHRKVTTTENYPDQMSVVPRLRNQALVEYKVFGQHIPKLK